MERLTHPRSSGIKTGYWSPEKKDALIERLAAYEDTGLTPQEIYSLKAGTILKMIGTKWIPVKERLPEEDERVILCTRYGTVKEGTYTERYGYAMRKGFFTENCFEELCDVAAWMPLPEPYQEEVNPDEERRRLSRPDSREGD